MAETWADAHLEERFGAGRIDLFDPLRDEALRFILSRAAESRFLERGYKALLREQGLIP